jgi:hypothetical protein
MKREIIEVLPTFWSPTRTTLNLFIFGMDLKLKLLYIIFFVKLYLFPDQFTSKICQLKDKAYAFIRKIESFLP